MIKLIILLAVGYFLYRAVKPKSNRGTLRGRPMNAEGGLPVDDEMIQDPVCRTFIPKREAVVLDRGGNRYYFCSDACKAAFQAEDE